MNKKTEVIETRVAKVWMGEDGIVREIFAAGAQITLDDMKEIVAIQIEYAKEGKKPVFADMSKVRSATREARVFSSGDDSIRSVSTLALLVGTPLSKVLGNFFIGLNKPSYPTKLFTSEEKAIEWLKGFVNKPEV